MGPVKHMAPEAIKKRYSEKSDSFAFGTFIWECTHQDEPFKDMEVFEVAKGIIEGTLRLKIDAKRMHPKLSLDETLPQLMRNCWLADEDARPSMTNIYDELSLYYQNLKQFYQKE